MSAAGRLVLETPAVKVLPKPCRCQRAAGAHPEAVPQSVRFVAVPRGPSCVCLTNEDSSHVLSADYVLRGLPAL